MLTTGTRLGPYEIQSPLGAGGMGEVYKARDTRLDRIVAIKVLPPALASDPRFRERFEREARTISQLNHPHICALHDVGFDVRPPTGSGRTDTGSVRGEPFDSAQGRLVEPRTAETVDYLVLEYLEGESLAAALARGPLKIEDAIEYATQIASALDAAHRAGVVHRDLKPGNVMLTRSGSARQGSPQTKLLDFGLAKVGGPAVSTSGLTAMPTTPAGLTAQGTILGTFQYMAPEQIEGQDADARTDIFAFGALLYEMVTGKKAFGGKSHASLISSILKDEPPPISGVQPVAPPILDRIIHTCLAKHPDERFQSAHDLVLQLKWALDPDARTIIQTPMPAQRRGRSLLPWSIAALFALTAVALAVVAVTHWREAAPLTTRFTALAPEQVSDLGEVAISPDGTRLVFVGRREGQESQLWTRPLDTLAAQPVPGTDGATYPFWSPDSQSVAFFAAGRLKKISVSGGPPQTLCDAPLGRGGAWSADGVIVFSPNATGPLHRVSAAGGPSTPVTSLAASESAQHRFPAFLPDGRRFLFKAVIGTPDVFLGSIEGSPPVKLAGVTSDSLVAFAPPGYLLFVRENTLFAQPFDARKAQITGEAVPVAEDVMATGFTYAAFSVSMTSTLAYMPGTSKTELSWYDRSGKRLSTLPGPRGISADLALSPDGNRIALSAREGTNFDVWVIDSLRRSTSRLTFAPVDETNPIWSPDGSRIAFSARNKDSVSLNVRESSGAGTAETLASNIRPTFIALWDWTRDGQFMVYGDNSDPQTGIDLWALPLTGDRKPVPMVRVPGIQVQASVSPDGRWIAYSSSESGKFEVYVQPFPSGGGRWQVSTSGGVQPQWRRDGKEILFLGLDSMLMAAPVKPSPSFDAGLPAPLFRIRVPGGPISPAKTHYAATADGQRFVVNMLKDEAITLSYVVVLNWPAALRK